MRGKVEVIIIMTEIGTGISSTATRTSIATDKTPILHWNEITKSKK
jgi:hypothetical protein